MPPPAVGAILALEDGKVHVPPRSQLLPRFHFVLLGDVPESSQSESSFSPLPPGSLKPFGRSLPDFSTRSSAEDKLLAACRTGDLATVSNSRPVRGSRANRVRASFVRFLLLGGDKEAPVHERGVRLRGAWITGILDLDDIQTALRLTLLDCRIEQINARHGELRSLNLGGSFLKRGLNADDLSVGNIFLRLGFCSPGEVRLPGARISGNLECGGGSFGGAGDTALRLGRVEVSGTVHMNAGFKSSGSVWLDHARIGGGLSCNDAEFLRANGVALSLQNARIEGSIHFRCSRMAGTMRLHNAHIGGNFECDGSHLANKDGIALNAERATVAGSLFLRNGFEAVGTIRLANATIGGDIEAGKGRVDAGSGDAMACHSARISGSVRLSDGFAAIGLVQFRGAHIGESLVCNGGRFEAPGSTALSLDRAVISGSVFLRAGFLAKGEVRFTLARIGSGLECDGGRFTHEGLALTCAGATISGPVFLRDGFHSVGEVNFLNSHLGGGLECRGGRLENPAGKALTCTNATIGGSVLLNAGFSATGSVVFVGARITGSLECAKGRFQAHSAPALNLVNATVTHSVLLNDGFEAQGEVRLAGASIDSSLVCSGGTFANEGATALTCARARVRARLVLERVTRIEGLVDLTDLHVASLCDDVHAWRQAKDNLLVDGFFYDRFAGDAPTDAKMRIGWLDSQRGSQLNHIQFRPQPWEHLASVLKRMGHAHEARAVAVAKQIRLRRAGRLPFGSTLMHMLYGGLVGYGYRPWRLLLSVAIVWAFSSAAYWAAVHPSRFGFSRHLIEPVAGSLSPNCPDGLSRRQTEPCPSANPYADFEPLIFSADVLLPVIDFGYASKWTIVIEGDQGRSMGTGRRLRYLYWFEILFGWIAGLLLITVVRNLIKRD